MLRPIFNKIPAKNQFSRTMIHMGREGGGVERKRGRVRDAVYFYQGGPYEHFAQKNFRCQFCSGAAI